MQGLAPSYPHGVLLSRTRGKLFAMYYPAPDRGTAEHLVYVPPFASEMGHSRDVIAGLAREIASRGVAVLVPDLLGCGDSSGDFSEARWELWRDDLEAVCVWLEDTGVEQLSLWGLRLGATLAMDFAQYSQRQFKRILLWEPVTDGSRMLSQFLRMNLVPDDCRASLRALLSTPELRMTLPKGETVQVAGYEMANELLGAIDKLRLVALAQFVSAPMSCLEFVSRHDQQVDLALQQTLEQWKTAGLRVSSFREVAWPFWLFPCSVDYRNLVSVLRQMLNLGQA